MKNENHLFYIAEEIHTGYDYMMAPKDTAGFRGVCVCAGIPSGTGDRGL